MPLTPQILIVDDEMVSREALRALLSNEGYSLAFAENGSAGLAQAEANPPDLVLLDVMMPGMDGFEVCRRLRASARLAEVPVVMVTALDDRDSRLTGIEAGADDFISKPVNRNELRARVRTITRLNRYRRLLARQAQLDWVLDESRDGYVLMDPDGLIHYANGRARRLLEIPDDHSEITANFLGQARRFYKLEPPDAWIDWIRGANQEPVYLVRPESDSAGAFWLSVNELHGGSGESGVRLIQLRDVSQQTASAIETAKLTRLIPHKLNTPLNHICMSLSLLDDLLQGQALPGDCRELLDIVHTAADQLTASVGDIMQYMNVTQGHRQRGRFAIARMRGLLSRLCEELAIAPPRFIDWPEDEPVDGWLAVAESALWLVLHELLENAAKFHPERQPSIECRFERPSPDCARVHIADDGVRLSPSQLERVFIPFDQAEKRLTGETPGMGLGLPLVRTLLWQVGGGIALANREDCDGIVVRLELPVSA